MSLHINLTPEAEQEWRRSARRNRLASVFICLLTVALGAVALSLSIILLKQEPNGGFIIYTPPATDAPTRETPRQRPSPRPAPTPAPSIAPNLIISAEVSSTNLNVVDSPITSPTIGTQIGIDAGAGLLPTMSMTSYSVLGDLESLDPDSPTSDNRGGSALEGLFYDLKQTPSGAKTDVASWNAQNEPTVHMSKAVGILHEFIEKDWSPKVLAKYYRSRTKLYAGCFYLPSCDASYAPVAYRCADRVAPKAWVAVYRGKVRAPKSGKFRFVGTGDDVLAVRFNRKTVLEAGWCIPSRNDGTIGSIMNEAGKKYHDEITRREENPVTYYQYPEIPKWNRELGGLTAGDVFEVKEGNTYPIEILISEVPGGAFGFALLIQDLTDPTEKKASNGAPILQLFRTNFYEPTKANIESALKTPEKDYRMGAMECPPYDADSLIWTARP